MHIVHGGVVSGVAGGTPPGSAWDDPGTSVGNHPVHPIPQTLQCLLSAVIWVGGIPIGGIFGSVVNAHQPPDSLCAPPRAGHGSDSGGR